MRFSKQSVNCYFIVFENLIECVVAISNQDDKNKQKIVDDLSVTMTWKLVDRSTMQYSMECHDFSNKAPEIVAHCVCLLN